MQTLKDLVEKYYGNWPVIRPRRCYWNGYKYETMGIKELNELEDLKNLRVLNELGDLRVTLIRRWVESYHYYLLAHSINNIYYQLCLNIYTPNFGSKLEICDFYSNYMAKLINCEDPPETLLSYDITYRMVYHIGDKGFHFRYRDIFDYKPHIYEFPSRFDIVWVGQNAQNGSIEKQFEDTYGHPPTDDDYLPLNDATMKEITIKSPKPYRIDYYDDDASDIVKIELDK